LNLYLSNTLQITLPSGHPDGLSFADMDGHVELRPIPNTNIFIIRQRTDSSLSSECTCVSKRHYYTISFGVNRIQIVKVRTMFVSYNNIIQQQLLLGLTKIIIVRRIHTTK
jgi:hypothetical protein